MRWATPVIHFRRTVTEDGARIGDQTFNEGDKVVLWYASANRDADVFDDPFTLRHRPHAQRPPRLRRSRDRTSASAPTWPGARSR